MDGPGTLTLTASASCTDNIIFNGGTLVLAMTGNAFTGGTTVNGGLLPLDASSVVSGGTLVSSPLGTGVLGASAAAPCRTTATAAPWPLP